VTMIDLQLPLTLSALCIAKKKEKQVVMWSKKKVRMAVVMTDSFFFSVHHMSFSCVLEIFLFGSGTAARLLSQFNAHAREEQVAQEIA